MDLDRRAQHHQQQLLYQSNKNNSSDNSDNNDNAIIIIDENNEQQYSSLSMRRKSSYDFLSSSPYNSNHSHHRHDAASSPQTMPPSQRASRRRVRSRRRGSLWRLNMNSMSNRAAGPPAGFHLPVKDTLICLLFLMACCAGLFIGFTFVFVKGKSHTGSIYTPLIQSRTHAPPWHGPKQTPVTVFYNVFVAHDPFLAGLNRLIVEEQLGQVGTSFAASNGDLHVFYTSIGDPIEQDWIQSLCSMKYNMTCTQTQHYRKADEDVTLSKLYQYCERHPDHSVVYLHNKGSLHPHNKGQDRWRRTMTAAATSQLCLEPPLAPLSANNNDDNNDQCNACGMLFQPLPAPHFPVSIALFYFRFGTLFYLFVFHCVGFFVYAS